MKRIGLTGGIATGKSHVAQAFVACGAALIDADAIVHMLYATSTSLRDAIRKTFGNAYVTNNGAIDRETLGRRIFADPAARKQLEEIVHPPVRALMKKQELRHAAAGAEVIVFDIPLLFESGETDHFDAIIVVTCSAQAQLERVMKRYRCTDAEAQRRIASQMPMADKCKGADHVIDTTGAREETDKRVREIASALRASQ